MNKFKDSFYILKNSEYTIDKIETLEELSKIKNDWERLFNLRKEIPLFSSYEVFVMYYRTIIKNFKNVKINVFVIRKNNKQIVAIFPFTCETRQFSSFLSFIELDLKNSYLISFYYFLIDPTENPEEIFQLFVQFLKKRMIRWDIIRFTSLPENEYLSKLFISIINKSYKIDFFETNILFIDCKGEFDEYTKNDMDQKDLKQLKKKCRRIERVGKVTIVEIKNPQEIEEGLSYFYEIEDSGWKGDEGTSLKQSYYGEYYKELAFHFSKEDKFRLYFLRLNDDYIAGIYALIDHEILYMIKRGYSHDFSYYSPSSILFYLLLEKLFEKKTIRKIDMYGTFARYHKTFGKNTRKAYHITIFNRKFLPTIYYIFFKVLKKVNYHFQDDRKRGKIFITIKKHFYKEYNS